MKITKLDPFTGKMNTLDVPVTEDQLERWRAGELIQNAMPDVSADDREFLMTGITPDSWAKTFGEE